MRTICGFTGDADKNLLKKMETDTSNKKYFEKNISLSAPAIAVNEQGIVIAFNGVIYNKEELERQTDSHGNEADVLLKLYTTEGEKFIHKINGSFALAVWDPDYGLLLGRDRNGERNLYYCYCQSRFFFSSRIIQLYQNEEFNRGVSHEGMTNFFAWGHIPTNHTLFKDVYRVLPSTTLHIKNQTLTTKPYWQLDLEKLEYTRSDDEWCNCIYNTLENSIKRRRNKEPYGILLGGLDSSAIAAIMKKGSKDIKTFTVYFNAEKTNEPYAKRTAEYLELDHYDKIVTPEQVIRNIPDIITALENPTADINATIPTFFGYQLAKEEHVKTIFTGDGADLAFWGNPPCNYILKPTIMTILYNSIPYTLRVLFYNLIKTLNNLGQKESQDSTHITLLNKLDPHNPLPYHLFFIEKDLSRLTLSKEFDIYNALQSSILKNYYLNIWDQVRLLFKEAETMGWGVSRLVGFSSFFNMDFEIPMEDYLVKELAASIPPELKQISGVDKYIWRKTIHKYGLLPDDVIYQKKEAFGQSLKHDILPSVFNSDVENYMHNTIGEISTDIKQYMDTDFVDKCIRNGTLNQKFALLIFSSWYQSYML